MTQKFEHAWPVVLDHEVGPYRKTGGLVDHPDDPGGLTKWGITLPFLQRWGTIGDVDRDGDVDRVDLAALSEGDAYDVFLAFWHSGRYDRLRTQELANKVFDVAIHAGEAQAARILQRAINRLKPGAVAVDGDFGPLTLLAANDLPPDRLLAAIREEQRAFYLGLFEQKPRLRTFRDNWLRRAAF